MYTPDKIRGQRVTAYAVLRDHTLTPEELAPFCKDCPDIANFKRDPKKGLKPIH